MPISRYTTHKEHHFREPEQELLPELPDLTWLASYATIASQESSQKWVAQEHRLEVPEIPEVDRYILQFEVQGEYGKEI